MTKLVRSVLTLACALLVAVTTTFAATGCAPKDEKAAAFKAVDEELSQFKNMDDLTLNMLLASQDFSEFENYGIDMKEYFKNILKKFDYNISDIKLEGDTGTATVSFTNVNVFDLMETVVTDAVTNPELAALMTSEDTMGEFYQKVMDIFYQKIDEVETATNEFSVPVVKGANGWEIPEAAYNSFMPGIFGMAS